MAAQLALGRELRESDPAEAQRLLEGVFNQTSPENHPAFHTRAATSLASVHYARGEREEQRRYAEAALKAAQASGSRRGLAVAWATMGVFHLCQCEYDRARECYEQCLTLARATGYLHAAKLALNNLASVAGKHGRSEQALGLFQEGLAVDEQAHDHVGRSKSLYNIAWTYSRMGRDDEAAEYLYRAIESCESYGPEGTRLQALNFLAGVYEQRGDLDRAKQLFLEVIRAADRPETRGIATSALVNLGQIIVDAGDLSAGRQYLERALAASDQAGGWETFKPDVLAALARLALAEHRHEEASRLLDEAEQLASRAGWQLEMGYSSAARARLHASLGQIEQAQRCYEQAAEAYSGVGDNYDLARLRLDWARWLVETGSPDAAVTPAEQAAASARRLGATVVAEQASRLLFELRKQSDREAALLEGLAGLSALGLDPTARLERMCELVARAAGFTAAAVLLGNEPVVTFGRPDLAQAKRLARKSRPATTDTSSLVVLAVGERPAGAAWFERSAPSTARLDPVTVERISQVLSEPLVLLQEAQARLGVATTSSIPGLRFRGVVGRNRAVLEGLKLIPRLAQTTVPVLIRGESGTGKELVARSLHESGPRWDKPFVAVNCAAVPAGLLEAEFFGVTRGAATGVNERTGKFEQAHLGTIFLDEVGDMSPDLQARLLRVLQEKTFERVGGTKQIVVDTRVVAATNQDLERLVREGRFREDLYYRLNGCEIVLPPLRERQGDIPVLARYFVSQCCHGFGRDLLDVDSAFVEGLCQHDWPGNIRELHHSVERCVLMAEGRTLTAVDLPQHVQRVTSGHTTTRTEPTLAAGRVAVKKAAQEAQKTLVLDCLNKTGWNVRAAAKLAGYGHTQFYRLMHKHDIRGARRRTSGR